MVYQYTRLRDDRSLYLAAEADWNLFEIWIATQLHRSAEVQFDIETTVTPWWCDKKVITMQFGSSYDQWVLEWAILSNYQRGFIQRVLEDPSITKIIHNAMFECVVCLFHGIRIQNVYDTMLCELVLLGGFDPDNWADEGEFALTDLVYKYTGKFMSKYMQTQFKLDEPLTAEHVRYAAGDVQPLQMIKTLQIQQLGHHDLDWVAALENEAVLAYAEMTYHGLYMDEEAWLKNLDTAAVLVDQAHQALDAWIAPANRPLWEMAIKLKYVSETDRCTINWNSHHQKLKILQYLIPELPGASKPMVAKWCSQNIRHPLAIPLTGLAAGDPEGLQNYLLEHHRDWLVEQEILLPAGVARINWNSTTQVLPLLRSIVPKLKDMSAETFGRQMHPIFRDIEAYKDKLKLTTAYGAQFIRKYREPDGKFRPTFNQIVSTGRVSCRNPNMQQIPVRDVGKIYRNCFHDKEGFQIVGSDYAGCELVIIAHLSREPRWLEALHQGRDLHGMMASLVFKDEWRLAAEEGCLFYKDKAMKKCACAAHLKMRELIKIVNFGLAYGMTEFKLASTMRSDLKTARRLLEEYFRVVPGIKHMLELFGRSAVIRGYSMTPAPFFRKRWYPEWEKFRPYIPAHIRKIENIPELAAIERQGKNLPIQGGNADLIKLATCMIYWYIHDNHLSEQVRLLLQVHDEQVTGCHRPRAEWWKDRLTGIMLEAALVFIPTGEMKCDTVVSDNWTKT